jgi:hypothetical protein
MLHHSSGPRAGITLVEVLAAIFIMGVGLLALLTLFPLGALSMARAVRDDRAAAAGANAGSIANGLDFRNNAKVLAAMAASPPGPYKPAAPDGPGYPVYLDPYYAQLLDPGGSNPFGAALGSSASTPGVPRTAGNFIDPGKIARLFSLLDEISFDPDGRPTGSTDTSPSVTRPSTYTWAYLIRTPSLSSKTLTELSVVVSGGRSLDAVRGETAYPASSADPATTPTNIVRITWTAGAEKPRIRKGTWVLDTSYNPVGRNYGAVNGYFYQVAGTRDTGATSMDLELESNLRASVTNLVVMENVITVLERGTGWKP